MPILAKEPDMYPESLLEDSARDADELWFAMYTLARREKELMRKLLDQKIAYYGPVVQNRKRSPQGRIRTSWIPLFTGYVFVRGDEVARYNAVATGCVSRCIGVPDREELITDLRQLRFMLERGPDVRPEPKPVVGRTAIVKRGAMAGLTGTVTKAHGNHRLTVLVHFMQQGASVLIDEADVELL